MPFLFVIPSEAKEYRFKIATPACQNHPPAGRPACHNTALRCAGTSLTHLAMTMYRSVRDMTLVDGDPIANIKLIEDPVKNFLVIMKDGKLFKNIVP